MLQEKTSLLAGCSALSKPKAGGLGLPAWLELGLWAQSDAAHNLARWEGKSTRPGGGEEVTRGRRWPAGAGKLLVNGGATLGNAAAALGKEKPKKGSKRKEKKRKKRKVSKRKGYGKIKTKN